MKDDRAAYVDDGPPIKKDFTDHVGGFVARHPRKIVVFFLVLFLVSLPALASLSSFSI